MEALLHDVRYAARMLAKSPGFTAVAVLSLALGIGATTAAFSVFNAAVLRPLPVAEPQRLVKLLPQRRGERFVLFNPVFEEVRRTQTMLSGMFAASDQPFLKVMFEGASAPTYLRGSLVSANYFSVLGLSPALGRLLTEGDDEIAGSPGGSGCAAVISHLFWVNHFLSSRIRRWLAARCACARPNARSSGWRRRGSPAIKQAIRLTSGCLYGHSPTRSCSPAAGWRSSRA